MLAELEVNIYKHLGAADFEACAGVGWIVFHAELFHGNWKLWVGSSGNGLSESYTRVMKEGRRTLEGTFSRI